MSHKIFRSVFCLILVLAQILGAGVRPARAAGPWYVTTAGDDNNDCLSPATACATINGAIGKAGQADTINVAAGIYTASGAEVVLIDRDITLSGGWDESFTTQSGTSTVDGEGLRRGMTVNIGVSATIERFTLQNGNVTGNGGGIHNAGTLTVTNSIISDNIAGNGSGGGIYNSSSGVFVLSNSTVAHNGSSQMCWTIFNEGTFTMTASVVEENTTTTIYCAVITILNASGPMTITNSTIRNNLGGIYNYATLTLDRSLVSGNVATSGNSPGGIYNWGGTLTVNNSTISGNATAEGGGIFAGGAGTIRLNNSTISNNTASTGGGIYNQPNAPADIMMQNTLLAGNTASGTGTNCSGSIGSSGFNLVGAMSHCDFIATTGDMTDTDPFLGPLQDNGGPTFTHALLPQSPAINAGNIADCTDQNGTPLLVDQRGITRPQGIGCDIGAYEYVFSVPGPATSIAVLSGSGQTSPLNTAFSKPLRVVALDNDGNRISGITVTFTAPASGPSGTFADTGTNTTSVDTDAGGVATASIFTANNVAGAYSVSASAPGLGSVNFNLAQVFRPANDNFANATPIGPLPFNDVVDNTNATTEPGEPQQYCSSSSNTVWYSFTPAVNATVRADMSGSSFSDNILLIYQASGPGFGGLSFLNCASYSNSATFSVQAGVTYYFQAGSIYGGSGELHFNLQELPRPANDDFANAKVISSTLPFDDTVDTTSASMEAGETTPSCAYSGPISRSVWFAFTPTVSGAVSASIPTSVFTPVFAAYTGSSLANLTEVGCRISRVNLLTLQVSAGTTYYFQVGDLYPWEQGGSMQFRLEVPPPPVAGFDFYPGDPSRYDVVQFSSSSYDPANVGLQAASWNFGDGSTASGNNVSHQYAKDGAYSVTITVTTQDGRTASTTQTVQVRTHDVAIIKVTAPQSANAGQTRAITISVRNKNYPESITIDLYKSVPGGYVWVGFLTLQVPVSTGNKTTTFSINYTFTAQDAQVGKVTFRAVATIGGARDAFPSDNEGISSPPTKVAR